MVVAAVGAVAPPGVGDMSLSRWFRHLMASSAGSFLPEAALGRITQAIAADESRHRGELCFAVESSLGWRGLWAGQSPRNRAFELFSQLRVWDTAENNGVLIYLLLADHRIEIVADRGLDARVSTEQWRGICLQMEERLAAGDPEAAVLLGLASAGDFLAGHFPRIENQIDDNELPDRPQLL